MNGWREYPKPNYVIHLTMTNDEAETLVLAIDRFESMLSNELRYGPAADLRAQLRHLLGGEK